MAEYFVVQVTPYPEFNWAFTYVISFFPVGFGIKALIRTAARS